MYVRAYIIHALILTYAIHVKNYKISSYVFTTPTVRIVMT